MNTKYALALITAAVPCLALGQDVGSYQCSFGELQRRVEILTEPGVAVPCEVHYYKDTEAPGEKQVLWSADSQEGYCESKTEEFIAKLEGWGWDCGQGEPSAPAMESEVDADDEAEAAPPAYDDTDVLSPGTPSE
ncbi:MAG: hypothetical protein OEM60_07600 [Gammaproteobacteria bacterium]|nr:hypothetical protein [Gammaproteobacteria bacterium]MDH3433705.1 hypothetical protein [Gammaproteobacteria bacterium]